jgi:hypothetical protein
VAQVFEAGVAVQMLDIALGAGEQIVRANDFVTLLQQSIDQMRSEKSGAPGNQDPFAATIYASRKPSNCIRSESEPILQAE